MYNQTSSITYDAYLQTEMQTLSVSESTTSMQIPNLSCSFSGSTNISFNLSSYNGADIPSFVLINSTTGVLNITAPSVSNSTSFSFIIISTVSGVFEPAQKIINLIVYKCTASNCRLWSVTNSTVCTSCNSGYSSDSGSCILSYKNF